MAASAEERLAAAERAWRLAHPPRDEESDNPMSVEELEEIVRLRESPVGDSKSKAYSHAIESPNPKAWPSLDLLRPAFTDRELLGNPVDTALMYSGEGNAPDIERPAETAVYLSTLTPGEELPEEEQPWNVRVLGMGEPLRERHGRDSNFKATAVDVENYRAEADSDEQRHRDYREDSRTEDDTNAALKRARRAAAERSLKQHGY